MKYFVLTWIILSSFFSVAIAKNTILVSYFEPFSGRELNHTYFVAREIAKRYQNSSQYSVELCPLGTNNPKKYGLSVSFHYENKDISPVYYEKRDLDQNQTKRSDSFEQLKSCIMGAGSELKAVYSLGEGFCDILLETTSYNQMGTDSYEELITSNGYLYPQYDKILPEGPNSVDLDFQQNLEAFCIAREMKTVKKSIRLSSNPGRYTCNNLAYNVKHYLNQHHPHVAFAFIHVPRLYQFDTTEGCNPFGSTFQAFKNFTRKNKDKRNNEYYTAFIAERITSFMDVKNTLNFQKPCSDCMNSSYETLASTQLSSIVESVKALKKTKKVKSCMTRHRQDQEEIKKLTLKAYSF